MASRASQQRAERYPRQVTERRGREQETQDDDQSMLHVLDEPFAFTQRPALTVRAFCDELKKHNLTKIAFDTQVVR